MFELERRLRGRPAACNGEGIASPASRAVARARLSAGGARKATMSPRTLARLLVASLSTSACLPTTYGVAEDAASMQACAERALRRRPDAALVADAHALYSAGCARGDAAACSSLGVMHEVGLGTERAPGRALTLYVQACAAGNTRGCANLGAALSRGLGGPARVGEGVRSLARTCEARDLYACLEHARTLAHGDALARRSAAALFELACEGGEVAACAEAGAHLAEHEPERALSLLTTACVAGEVEACDALARLAPRPRDPPPAATRLASQP
jgi:TPR repeat protein